MTISQDLFKRAQDSIPGGVNSPVRAFNGVGGTRCLLLKHRARLHLMLMATVTLIMWALGVQ